MVIRTTWAMIDVNLMCPIPLLIFLIRGKEYFICREGDEMGLMLCCTWGLENFIARHGSLLTWGQKVMDPKLGTLVSSWEWLCLYLLLQIICMSNLFFFFSFLLDWFLLALLNEGVRERI